MGLRFSISFAVFICPDLREPGETDIEKECGLDPTYMQREHSALELMADFVGEIRSHYLLSRSVSWYLGPAVGPE